MAGTIGKIRGVTSRKSGQALYGRVQGNAGTDITQATIGSISWAVYRQDAGGAETLTGSGTLTVAAVVFDALQTTDPRATGSYNFLAVLPASAFAVGGRPHRCEVTFVPASGEQFTQIWESSPV